MQKRIDSQEQSMDYRAMNFDWNHAKAFLISAELGSFSAAAKALNVSQTTLGRQVAALEEELGLMLFARVGGGLEITPSGLTLIDHVKKMGEAANMFSLSASGKATSLEGKVCISASESFAVFELPRLVKEMKRLQPKIQIEIISTNESSDIKKREADIAIRNYRPTQADLIAKKINTETFHLYATKEYLESIGPMKKLKDLAKADFVGMGVNEHIVKDFNQKGMEISLNNFKTDTNSHLAHWQLAKEGLGIGLMAGRVGDKDPSMFRVLDHLLPDLSFDNWLVTHKELKTSNRIRYVFDFIYENF